MLSPTHSFLAQATADNHSTLANACQIIIDVVGVIGILLIVIFFFFFLIPMIPDFFRYMHLKSM
jgi:hypothetical protein